MFKNIFDDSSGKGTLEGKVAHGIVLDNNDPEKLLRVKVRVSEMHSGRPDNEIPWSMQYVFSKQGHTNQIGSVAVPVIGAKVLIMYPEDDEHDNYYVADYHDKSTQIAELLVDYPNVYGHIDASGNLWLVNTKQDTVTFVHLSGSYTKFYKNGDMDYAAAGKMNIFSQGDVNIKSNGNVNIDGANINLNSGVAQPLTITPRIKPNAGTAPSTDF